MSATATTTTTEVIQAIGEETVLVSTLVESGASTLAIGQAWARGEIEFGKRTCVSVGRAGKPGEGKLIVEPTWNWTGPKTVAMQSFRQILASEQAMPEYAEYAEYPDTNDPKADPNKSPLRAIDEDEARAMVALHVRLTDKGLSALEESAAE